VASVEGEFFTAEVVAQVRAIDNREVIQQLSSILDKQHRLVAAQGIQRVGPDGQRLSRYRFRHNLFQKYLYHSLDEVERAHQHEAVGNVLEALYQGQTDDIAIQLARHFLAAEQMSKAMHYLQPAGDAAARVYANAEAVAHYSRALALAKQIDADRENLTHLYTHLGRALELDSQFSRALANYQDMKELAHQRGDDVLELAALMALATLQTMKNPVRDEAQALALSEQSVTLARELGDRVAEAKTLWNLSNLYRDKNDLAQAIEYGERSLALTRQLNLREQQAFTLNDLALAYVRSNRLDQAKELLGEAIELWQGLENQPMLANSLTTSSNLHTHTGQYDKAIALSNKAHQISQSIDNIWGQSYSLIMTGYIYWERGEPERAIAVMKKSIRLGEQSGFLSPQLYTRSQLAAVYGSLGAIKDGLKAAYLAKSVAEKEKPGFSSFVPATLAQLHLTRDNLAEAEAVLDTARSGTESEGFNVYSVFVQADSELALKQGDYERAIAVTESLLADLRQSGAQAYIPSTLFLQARALLAQGQDETALERLLEAHTISKAIGSRRMLWQILFALSRLEPDPAEAERMRKLAQEIVEYIAGNVGDTELRASFLGLPEVKAVLG
jgi:tetratricopeptide (TPR) repeat protein